MPKSEKFPEINTFEPMDTPACLLEAEDNTQNDNILAGYVGKCGCTCLCPSPCSCPNPCSSPGRR